MKVWLVYMAEPYDPPVLQRVLARDPSADEMIACLEYVRDDRWHRSIRGGWRDTLGCRVWAEAHEAIDPKTLAAI